MTNCVSHGGPRVLPRRSAWLAFGGSVALLLVAYWPTAVMIAAEWSKDPFGHGYLVLPAFVYLAWTRRQFWMALTPTPTVWGLPLVALLAFVWLLGNLTATEIVQQLCLVGMFGALAWTFLGTAIVRALMFPLGILIFALPLGDRLVPVLQDFTARFAVSMLKLVDMPVLLEGHVISIPGSSWQVADACSGINYLVSSLAVGYIYAGLVYHRWVNRIGFVLAAAVTPVLANAVRVFTTLLIASFGGTSIAAGMGHDLFGLGLFALITYVLIAAFGRWQDEGVDSDSRHTGPTSAVAAGPSFKRLLVLAAVGVLFLSAGPASASLVATEHVPNARTAAIVPVPSSRWTVVDDDFLNWEPRFLSPSSDLFRVYRAGAKTVKVCIGFYAATEPAVKLATAGTSLFGQPWWSSGDGRVSTTLEGRPTTVRETILRSPEGSLRVWSWYWVDGRATGSDYVAKVLLAKAKLFRDPRGAAVIAIATDNRADAEARRILSEFARDLSFAFGQ